MRVFVVSAVFCLSLFSQFCRAESVALQHLTALLDPVKSLRAHFEQTVSDADNVVLQNSQGTIAVARGNRLRWETTSPFAYLIVTDGKVMWRYDHDLEQATRQQFSGRLADTPALILSGETQRIGADYAVTQTSSHGDESFQLSPRKKEGALFGSLTLVFRRGTIAELVLQDNLDQRTDIRFSALENNPVLADSLFEFTPPKGVDVVIDDEP